MGAGPGVADSLSARALLDHAVTRAHELSGQPAIEAQMLDMVGRIRTRVGDYAAALDEGLNDKAFIVPGLGDFGDRLFGTG